MVDAERGAKTKLRMVWLVSPICEKNFLAVWFVVVFTANFSRYKCRINLDKYARIIKSHRPAILTIVLMENAQAMRHLFNADLLTPDMKNHIRLELTGGVQVIGIKHE